jgi:hypothetical protein
MHRLPRRDVPLGDPRFNSFYSQTGVGNGRVMVSGLYGALRIQPKAGGR